MANLTPGNPRPIMLDNLLNGKVSTTTTTTNRKARKVKPTTTTKETTVKKKQKPEAVATAPTPTPDGDLAVLALTMEAVSKAVIAEEAGRNAEERLREASIAVANANRAGVSFRALEAKATEAGTPVSKATFNRMAKIGAMLIADPTAKPSAVKSAVVATANGTDKTVALPTVDEMAQALTEDGQSAMPKIARAITKSESVCDYEANLLLAVASLTASANLAGSDDQRSALLASLTMVTEVLTEVQTPVKKTTRKRKSA